MKGDLTSDVARGEAASGRDAVVDPSRAPASRAGGGDAAAGAVAVQPYWGLRTRDRWFFGLLFVATAALLVLFTPFLYVLALAGVVVVVSWPAYEWILGKLHGRRAVATAVMMLVQIVGVLVPVTVLMVVFVRQAMALVQGASRWVDAGGLDAAVVRLQEALRVLGIRLGFEVDLATSLGPPLQEATFGALQRASTGIPGLIGATAGLGIDSIVFLFAMASLYHQGPSLLQAIRNLVPMDDRYENKLFAAFRHLANNLVLGSLVTGVIQGLIAAVGYAIAGVDQIVFLGILTVVGSFIPLLGTALVWVPVTLFVLATDGLGWAVFIALWSVLLTASVDNFMKPMFLRNGTQIHPLLIFLGVFSGLIWMGVPGLLVGPMIVVFFLAMYTSYLEDFLRPPETPLLSDVTLPDGPGLDPPRGAGIAPRR